MSIKKQTPPKSFITFLATACYCGYLPWFPGTWASIFTATVVYCFAFSLHQVLGGLVVFTVLGVWAATWYDRLNKTHDANAIVIDEVAGQLIALLPLLILRETGLGWYTGAVILFRLFDIKKPLGIYRLQSLPEGFGVVADDLLAGFYAALLLAGVVWIRILL